jgi:hypothetical protein
MKSSAIVSAIRCLMHGDSITPATLLACLDFSFICMVCNASADQLFDADVFKKAVHCVMSTSDVVCQTACRQGALAGWFICSSNLLNCVPGPHLRIAGAVICLLLMLAGQMHVWGAPQ